MEYKWNFKTRLKVQEHFFKFGNLLDTKLNVSAKRLLEILGSS